MSTTGKNLSYIKRKLAQELRPNVISQTITFKHEATSFVTTIDLANLNTPTSAANNGFVNPSASVLPYLITFRQNVSVESTYKGKLIDYQDYIIVNNTQIELLNGLTTEPGEIFTIKLVIPNDVDTKAILDQLSDPSNLINKYRYNVSSVKNYYDPDLGGQILTILQYVSQKNRSKNPVLGKEEGVDVFTTSLAGGSLSYIGGVLLPDGRVFILPINALNAVIYNPINNTVFNTSLAGGSLAYKGGVLLPDGRIFCVAYSGASNCRIYNPKTNSSTPTPVGNGYHGAVLLQDGRVFVVPYNAPNAVVYDPITNSSTPIADITGSVSGNYSGCVLLPDGKVFVIPNAATSPKIYDPILNQTTTPTGWTAGGGYNGGVLLSDGRVFLVPSGASNAVIYNPTNNSIFTVTGITGGSGAYKGGVLLPDGRVFIIPTNATEAKIYNPTDNSVYNVTNLTGGGLAYESGILLNDGRVLCIPVNAPNARIVSGSWCQPMNEFQFPQKYYYHHILINSKGVIWNKQKYLIT